MRKPFELKEEEQIVRVTSRCPDNLPGIESQFDPAAATVSISVLLEKLKLTKAQEALLIKLVGDRFDVDDQLVRFDVVDFPLKEQNQKRALEILRDLIAYVKVPRRNYLNVF